MFGLSWAETLVILVVALIVIKPQDIPGIIRAVRSFFQKCKQLQQEITGSFSDVFNDEDITELKKEVQAINKDINYIVDMDGNLQETYDVKSLLEEKGTAKPKPSNAELP